MSEVAAIYNGNDMLLELSDLIDVTTGLNLNTANVTVTLTDASGVNVVGDTWPKTMAYVALSNGVYRATLVAGLTLAKNARYIAKITANGGAGLTGYWEKALICKARD